jgi:hypothetical protein
LVKKAWEMLNGLEKQVREGIEEETDMVERLRLMLLGVLGLASGRLMGWFASDPDEILYIHVGIENMGIYCEPAHSRASGLFASVGKGVRDKGT